MKWQAFAEAAPELAAIGAETLEEEHLCLIGTLRANGWPRISPTEVYFVDGELMLGMMPRSRKALDLLRDPRIVVVNPQCERIPQDGDFKLYGRAVEVSEPGTRERFADTQEAAIEWRPSDPFHLFAVDIGLVSYISFGEDRRMMRWTAGGGLERLRHPEDA